MKVFIGVGHGGADPGAAANGLREKEMNLVMAKALRDELMRHGLTVKMSRERDENDTLADEIREAAAFDPDAAISIHNNAGGGRGFEACACFPARTETGAFEALFWAIRLRILT